jgi:hypothetical protein
MSYYDDAYYALNANIASQNSMLVDLRYNYNRLLSKILTLGPDNVSEELVNEQLSIVNSIREKKQNISILEAQLTTFTPMQSPEVILQQILEQEQVSQTVQPAPEPAPESVPEPAPEPAPEPVQ